MSTTIGSLTQSGGGVAAAVGLGDATGPYYAQTFTVPTDNILDSVAIRISYNSGEGAEYRVLITTANFSGSEFHPGTVLFESSTLTTPNFGGTFYQNISVDTNHLALTSGQQYAIILDAFVARDSTPGTARVGLSSTQSGSATDYTGGHFVQLFGFSLPAGGAGTRADNFAADWFEWPGNDLAFTATFSSNTAPTLAANAGLTLNEAASATIAAARLDFNDAEQADSAITYTLDTTAQNGTLWLDANNNSTRDTGEELIAGETFTQADIGAGRLRYTHNGSETTTDGFQFDVADGAGGNASNQTFAITVTAQNDPPAITFDTVSFTDSGASDAITNNNAVVLSGTVSDVDGSIAQVEVFNGTTPLGLATVNAGGWSLTTTLADGPYNQLKATAKDNTGATTTATNSTSITVDTAAPAVQSITRAGANPTNAGTVQYIVTFAENVSGVDANDFSLATSGITGASVTDVTGSGTTYTVTVNTGSGDGTIGLNLADDDSVQDPSGNRLGGTGEGNGNFTGQVYTLDRTAPTVQSIVRAAADPTNAASVQYTVTFSENVSGIEASDFTLAATGVTGASVSNVFGSGTTYMVTVNTGSGDGTIGLNLSDDDSIKDAAGNPVGGTGNGNGDLTGQAYTLDRTAPAVQGITRAGSDPTNDGSVQYTVTYSEHVTGVDVGDFVLNSTGVSGASITGVTAVSGDTYTVTVNTGSGDGTIALALADDDSVHDGAGNALGGNGTGNGNFAGSAYTLDRTAPQVQSLVRADANPNNSASVQYTVTFSENVTGVDADDFVLNAAGINGASVQGVSGSANVYTVTVSTGSGNGTLGLDLLNNGSIQDTAGNVLGGPVGGSGTVEGEVYTLDQTPPTVTISDDQTGTVGIGGSVTFTFTFDEDVTGFSDADVTVANGSKGAFTAVDARTYTLVVTPDAGFEGDVTVDVAAAAAQDAALNGNAAAATQAVQAVDTLAPAAADDNAGVAENATVTGNVIAGAGGGAGQDVGAAMVSSVTGAGGGGTVGQALVGALGTLTLNDDGSFSYVADRADALATGALATDTFTYTVIDAGGNTDTADLVVTLTGVNDAPTGTMHGPITYRENAVRRVLDATLTVTDVDDTHLTGARVAITGGFVRGQDMLGFVSQHGIAGGYNATTGVLTLTGTATVADYQDVLRSVSYFNRSDNPVTAPRTVTFQADDGDGLATIGTVGVTVVRVNDAPVISSHNGAVEAILSIEENTTAVTTVTASDRDNRDLSFLIVGGEDAHLFQIDSSGVLSFREAPDFETPIDDGTGNSYQVRVRVTDGSAFDEQSFVVNVTDEDEPGGRRSGDWWSFKERGSGGFDFDDLPWGRPAGQDDGGPGKTFLSAERDLGSMALAEPAVAHDLLWGPSVQSGFEKTLWL